jgi:hypothetical protein
VRIAGVGIDSGCEVRSISESPAASCLGGGGVMVEWWSGGGGGGGGVRRGVLQWS